MYQAIIFVNIPSALYFNKKELRFSIELPFVGQSVNISHEIFNKNVNRDIDGLTGRLTYINIFSEINLGNRTNKNTERKTEQYSY